MARLFLDERNLRDAGVSEQNLRTLRVLTAFVEQQQALEEAQAELVSQGDAIDAANGDITAANLAINALDGRIDAYDALAPFVRQDQVAAPAYSAYAGQDVSAAYVEGEAQATDDAVEAVGAALASLIAALQTANVLT